MRDRQLKLRDEAAKALSNQRREQLRADVLVLYRAQQILQRTYKPWWDDRAAGDALRALERWLGQAARSGDPSGPPPDLGEFLR
ncbi:MAG: hypothetical protein QM809_10280 [Gordonia sp. (in: high G+C Gram-positive bacteria)]|uniref:hypothetical protein n=1 Tax=Gordonia sp. (in: high G+C Gram-positive bacteria) TaxID=84139 RepID=UPI0039E43F59